MPDRVQSAVNPGSLERRLHPRKQLLFPWIQLGANNGGIILDIGESGLAIQSVEKLYGGELPAMRFQPPGSPAWIETQGRIAWTDGSKNTAGVEFIGLPDGARNRIRQWLPVALHPSGSEKEDPLTQQIELAANPPSTREPESAVFVSESEDTKHQGRNSISPDKPAVIESARANARPPLYLSHQKTTSRREYRDRRGMTSSRNSGRLIGLTSAVLLAPVFFFLVHRSQRTGNGRQSTELIVPAKAAELPSGSFAYSKTLSADANLRFDRPTFGLQVGAMSHQENAEALIESLRRRNFPAFLFPRGSDRFYRVFVGPFGDIDSTLKVKEQLRKQGFDAFRTPCTPPTQ
jgi:cell division protein FtsN